LPPESQRWACLRSERQGHHINPIWYRKHDLLDIPALVDVKTVCRAELIALNASTQQLETPCILIGVMISTSSHDRCSATLAWQYDILTMPRTKHDLFEYRQFIKVPDQVAESDL
jgi:hypothetical protein